MPVPFTTTVAKIKYPIIVKKIEIGTALPGDVFYGDLHVQSDSNFDKALIQLRAATGRIWLMTGEIDPRHVMLATMANFTYMDRGVWFRHINVDDVDIVTKAFLAGAVKQDETADETGRIPIYECRYCQAHVRVKLDIMYDNDGNEIPFNRQAEKDSIPHTHKCPVQGARRILTSRP